MIPMWAGVYNGVLLLGVLLQCNGSKNHFYAYYPFRTRRVFCVYALNRSFAIPVFFSEMRCFACRFCCFTAALYFAERSSVYVEVSRYGRVI